MAAANSANISTIQILRSYANSSPSTLADGQLAYSFVSNTLFIGSNTGIISIGDPSTTAIAKSAQANTIYIQGVDIAQNTSISNKLNLSGSLNQTVSGNVYVDELYLTSNNFSANSVTVDGGGF